MASNIAIYEVFGKRKNTKDILGEVFISQPWKWYISLLINFHWLKLRLMVTPFCEGDWGNVVYFCVSGEDKIELVNR